MEFTFSHIADHLVVEPDTERLDLANAGDFLSGCEARLAGHDGGGRVVIDLGGVQFIDSTGLGALVALRRALRDPWALRLVTANPRVRLLTEMTRLDRVLPIVGTVREAVAA